MFDATSTVTALTSAYGSIGTILTYAIGVIVVLAVALMGLGYGIRILRKHGTGKKF